MAQKYPKVAQFKQTDAMRKRLGELEIELPIDDDIMTAAQGSPLGESMASLWLERREVDLGWRSSRRASGWPS